MVWRTLSVINLFGGSILLNHAQPAGVHVCPGQQPLHVAPNESTHPPVDMQVQVLVSLATVLVHPSELTSWQGQDPHSWP